jgi:hypothetical protein
MGKIPRFLGAIFGWGLLAGIVVGVLTFLVARYGPQGGDGAPWSFRGNGALIVPFGVGPALLAAGWTALVLHARGSGIWPRWSLCFGLVGLVIVLCSAGALIAFGSVGQRVSEWLSPLPFGWAVIAPAVAIIATVDRTRAAARHAAFVYVVAALLFAGALVVGFVGAEVVLSPGS